MKKYIFILSALLISFGVYAQRAGQGEAFVLGDDSATKRYFENNDYNASVNSRIMNEYATIAMENFNIGVGHYDKTNYTEAIPKFDKALWAFKIAYAPNYMIDNCLLYLSMSCAKNNDKGYALKYLSQISNSKKKNRDYAFTIGKVYLLIKENSLAEIQFLNSIKIDKYYKKGYEELLNIYSNSNNLEKANLIKQKMKENNIEIN